MAYTDQTWPWARRSSEGTFQYKNLHSSSFGYTESQKKIAAGTTTAILAATNGAAAAQTVTAGITQPDFPRAISVTPTVNTANTALSIVITGTNVEGKTITETFVVPVGSTTIVNGVKAFKGITNVAIPGNTAGLTITVGTRNILGIRHRLFPNNTTVKVYTNTTAYSTLTLQGVPTVTIDNTYVENNTVLPVTIPDGTLNFIICYFYDNWSDGTSFQDQPEYLYTTSTSSTSTSTSTTTVTTSTSSTSTSTTTTSTSTTTTSTSTTTTSTSTTTAP